MIKVQGALKGRYKRNTYPTIKETKNVSKDKYTPTPHKPTMITEISPNQPTTFKAITAAELSILFQTNNNLRQIIKTKLKKQQTRSSF